MCRCRANLLWVDPEMATKRVDLAPYYALTREGTYRVTATVHIKDWGVDIPSAPKTFNVINGAKMSSPTFSENFS